MKNLINWKELSRILAGNETSISRNRIPDIYKSDVESLIEALDSWSKRPIVTDEEILNFIKKKGLAKRKEMLHIIHYPNGFRIETIKDGYKLYDHQGNDLIGDLAKGEKVIDCHLYPNGFVFKTENEGCKIYDLQGNDLIGNLAKGEIVIRCDLYPEGFKFKTENDGWELYDLKGNDLIGDLANGEKVICCHIGPYGFGFQTKSQEWVKVGFDNK